MDNFDAAYLAHEYRLARIRITELMMSAPDDWSRLPVPTCPAWDVHDLLAHVCGIASEIVRGNPPGSDSQQWVDAIVDSRRNLSVAALIEEWTIQGPIFEEMAAETRRLSVPLSYDTVVHEHDLRHAVNRPGSRDTSGVVAAMEVGVWLMTNDLRRRGFGGVVFRAGGRDWHCGEGEVQLRLDLDSANLDVPPIWELLRLSGSRRSLAQARALPWEGPVESGLAAILHMDLPVHDIVE
jgi:uncharacterized protein (TIGR03083 family)